MSSCLSNAKLAMNMAILQKIALVPNNVQKMIPPLRKMAGNRFIRKTPVVKAVDLVQDPHAPNL
jgi:hypothetical protein